jgi:catechol 2,3-dioxygenase-like lactoylglutathione lyase family enzyme
MITGIDHIVIAAHSLERAIATYRGLGFTVVEGGRHPYGSYNALIGFADGSYIELLGFYEESPDHPWWGLLRERGGGLVDFCLATDDIRADHAAFRELGVHCSPLIEGGRTRPDGYYVKWINNKIRGEWQGLIPFIIEDLTPREERLPRVTDHANGVTGIHSIALATDDVARPAAVMAAVLGAEGQTVEGPVAGGRGLRFMVGGHALDYLAPTDANGLLAAQLAAHRPVPYAVAFNTTGASKRFDPSATEGVRIELAHLHC